MAGAADPGTLESRFYALKTEGKKLQNILSTVAAEYDGFMKRYNETNERLLAYNNDLRNIESGAASGLSSKGAIVLMLMDASSHKFCNELLKEQGPGGARAAILLRNALNQRVAATHPKIAREKYSLVIRIFTDLKTLGLSSTANGKMSSLVPFFTEFEKGDVFFDLVVTADQHGVKNKICNNLKLYMANEQCKHVFFAAAESPRYLHALEPFRKQKAKVTLVFGSGFDPRIRKLGIILVSFPGVLAAPPGVKVKASSTSGTTTTANKDNEKTAEDNKIPEKALVRENLVDVTDTERALWSPLFSSKLPACYIGGRIPINGAKQRIDIYVRAPTVKEIETYEARSSVQRNLCISYFLLNECRNFNCECYHGILNPETYHVLLHNALGTACSKGSLCRIGSCPYGHICQRSECSRAAKKLEGCRLPGSMHGLDAKVIEWVVPDANVTYPSSIARDTPVSLGSASSHGGIPLSIQEDFLA
ncbi:hypothetical protein PTNB73_03478 [Pyrenophora teres f. teres]|uniref:Uncharacterized protein n=2 Tax=Pyrenophora teres f. teres TaxID=97479 RepID=E3RJD1_PYRTT|nr:hypothetical protein PTT_08251 [Pyrenophora teres f. teres 0-1]KAE8838506.1 hypothetical protein HRS9139_02889 [Pyrenophora teres f. teres]KAE8847332.1 hypothetical protein HRS9122_04239 [Pyrenophora teres f. teres]KAE8866382.1 hypothetical protein PTNB29_03529 [Pyrenophora teres f. teres]KAE8872019.1 hypothetical protein PTNB73_03478 [Pyrenophora teres f. teres]